MKKIAVTGGLSSGKSTVCQIFVELGAYFISADQIVHQLLSPDTAIGQQIISLFGSDIISDHHLNRSKIAERAFSQPDLLRDLEKILHPEVFKEIKDNYLKINEQKTYPLFVAEVPLLYETQSECFYDVVIAIVADPCRCRQRFIANFPQMEYQFDQRMNQQISPLKKAEQAQIIIENNGSLTELKEKIKAIYLQLTQS